MQVELTPTQVSVTVAEAARLSGLGQSTIWSLIAGGKLESTSIGRRRLVLYRSLRRLIEGDQATRA